MESDWTNESPLLEESELEVEKDGDPEMEKGKVMTSAGAGKEGYHVTR